MNRKVIGSIIIVGAIGLMVFTFGRAMYYSPASEDFGIQTVSVEAGTTTIENLSVTESDEKPATLYIPKIGIEAHVQHLGVTSSGLMAVPSNFTDTGWYKYGPVPGQQGSSVIAGHQDNAMGLDGVFKKLERLEIGDDVYVEDENGKKLHFRVYKTELVPYNLQGAKLEQIFNGTGGKYLNLITCAGSWLPSAKTNDLRLIVYTELVS